MFANPCQNFNNTLLDEVSSFAMISTDMETTDNKQLVRRTMPFYSLFFDIDGTISHPQTYYRNQGKYCYTHTCKEICDNNLYPRRIIIKDHLKSTFRNTLMLVIPFLTTLLIGVIILYYQYVMLTRTPGVSDVEFKDVYGERHTWYGWTMAATCMFILCFIPTIAIIYERSVLAFGQKWMIKNDEEKVYLMDKSGFKPILWRSLPILFGLGGVILLFVIISFRSVSSPSMQALLGINIALLAIVCIVLFLRYKYPSTKPYLSFSSGIGITFVLVISITILALLIKYHPLNDTD